MLRKTILAGLAALGLSLGLALTSIGSAGAVTNGTPDTDNHYPYVGTIVLQIGDPGAYSYHYWCSGTLVAAGGARSSTAVALVANGHCFDNGFQQSMYPGSTRLGITTEPQVWTAAPPPAGAVHPGTGYIDPGYPRVYDDVGVYVLDEPFDVGVTLPRLPHAGELAEMDRSGDLVGTDATIVGYGVDLSGGHGANGIDLTGGGVRQFASEPVQSLARYYLHLQSNVAQGGSGACLGDSGAPRLLDQDQLLAAVTGVVGGQCQAPESAIRLDRADVLDFLHQHIG